MNPTKSERMKSAARIFIYIVLVIFLIRNVLDIVDQVTASSTPVTQQVAQSMEVPDTAKSVAQLFLENWYFIQPDQEDEDRINNLKPFVTQSLFDFISSNKDLSIENDQNSILNPNSSTTTTSPNDSNTNDPNKKFEGINATDVSIWKATWEDQKAGKVQITARLVTSDSKVLFLSLPVVKSGNTWQVDALPALVPEPKGSEKIAEEPDISITDKEEAIKTVLDSFFTDWLAGNSEAIKRYMVDGKPIATTNWLEKLNAEYRGVQSITPVSENPLKVKVSIMVKDKQNNVSMLLDYFITLEQKNGQWNIVSID